MSDLMHKKVALAFALLSFGGMMIGSLFSGATVVTAIVRGTEAAALFGLLILALGAMLVEKVDDAHAGSSSEHKKKDLDKTD